MTRRWTHPLQRAAQRAAYNAGVHAFEEKRSKAACPYPRGCREWSQWYEGWKDAEYLAKKKQTSDAVE